jgi:multiple antibiotic resistance protein
MSTWVEYVRFPVTLFTILTPFAAIPVYVSLTQGRSPSVQARVARMTVVTVLVVLTSAALAGDSVLRLLGSSLDAFRVGGGIALLLMGISSLTASGDAQRQGVGESGTHTAAGVVPLGLPVLAGPGAISTVIVQMDGGHGLWHLGAVLASIVLVSALVWATLWLAPAIGEQLGPTGLNIVQRVIGLMLVAMAIELIATGLRALFPGLT